MNVGVLRASNELNTSGWIPRLVAYPRLPAISAAPFKRCSRVCVPCKPNIISRAAIKSIKYHQLVYSLMSRLCDGEA